MYDVNNWSETEIFVEEGLHHWVLLGECHMHLHSALGMTNIVHLLLCLTCNIAESSRKVIISHVLERKLPECFVLVWVQFSVISRMLVSAVISHPHVEPFVSQDEPWCLILVVDKPSIRAVEEAVLKVDWSEAQLPDGAVLLLHSIESQNIAIVGRDIVSLDRVVKVLAVLHEM